MTRRTRSSSSSSSAKKFDVFEFNDEEQNIEKLSQRILGKFKSPSTFSPPSSVSKYDFLQAFAVGSNQSVDSIPDTIVLDAEQDDEEESKCSPEEVTGKPLEAVDDDGDEGDGGRHIENEEKCDNNCSGEIQLQHSADRGISDYTDFVESDFELKNQSRDVVSDDDVSSQTSSSSISTSNHSENQDNFGDQLVEDDSAAFEINLVEKLVAVIPDFIKYEDLYSTRSRLTFSCSSLILQGSTVNGTGETFKIEWATEDIIKIESCWFGNIETALINLFLKSRDYTEGSNTNQNPGYKLLKFAVYDSCWCKAEEAIKLLDIKYTNTWSTFFDIDADEDGNISALGQDCFLSQKRHFPNFNEAFDEVIYPKGEPDAVSISKRDIELLQPQTFINDTIIDFYIKYLKNKLPTDEQYRFHFFNSFFFRKLADLDKDPSSACDGRAAFQRVRKWTRKVNLFEKDYILIPINYSFHWSLIVICHPGEVTCFEDEGIKKSSKIPCILHMDSLKGSHKGLKNLFQSYLCEEWKARHSNVVDDFSSKFLHLRFASLELPQQENLYDCGLFLLHYVELFLEEAPINFNPFMITKFSNFLTSTWFPPPEASLKRSHIQKLIYDIFENNSLQAPPADCLDKGVPSEDSLRSCCDPPALWHEENPSNSTTELQTTDIQHPTASPIRVASCLREPVLFNDLQMEAITSSSDCVQISACHHSVFMSPLEEIEESVEEIALSLEGEKSQVGVLPYDFPSTPCASKDHRASETLQNVSSVNFVEAALNNSTTSNSVSEVLLDQSTHEDQPVLKFEESSTPDKTVFDYSISGEELTDYVIPDSLDRHDVDASVNCSSLQDTTSVTHQVVDLTQNTSNEEDTLVNKEEPLALEPLAFGSDDGSDAPDAKRPKLMNAGGSSRRFTRSMVKEACEMSCD